MYDAVKSKTSTTKTVDFLKFASTPNVKTDQSLLDDGYPVKCYNFSTSSGALKTGHGFKALSMPTSTTDLDSEKELTYVGSAVQRVWSFRWYSKYEDVNKYYIVYYNDQSQLCYANLFTERLIDYSVATEFSTCPTGASFNIDGEDCMIFSAPNEGIFFFSGSSMTAYSSAPSLTSICLYDEQTFAVLTRKNTTLVYSSSDDVTSWSEDSLGQVVFSDERGPLQKVLQFEDYVYVIRDYGITRITSLSNSQLNVSHVYQADGLIFSGSVSSSGERIYFFEKSGFYSFNGSSAQRIEFDLDEFILGGDMSNASSVCFCGKYYLALKLDFDDDNALGCESTDFVNNALFIYDLTSGNVEIVRGVDISSLCALHNPYKSKLVASLNGDNASTIGELTDDGQLFGEQEQAYWRSASTDLGQKNEKKRASELVIKTKSAVSVTIKSEQEEATFDFDGDENLQRRRINVLGKEFFLSVSGSSSDMQISDLRVKFNLWQR